MPSRHKIRIPIQGLTKFDPSSYGSVRQWFRADTAIFTDVLGTTPATKTGDLVRLWVNQNADQDYKAVSGVNLPTYQLNAINGWPAIRFSSTIIQYLQSPGSEQVNYPHATFIVAVFTAAPGSTSLYTMLSIGNTGGNGTYWGYGVKNGTTPVLQFPQDQGLGTYYTGTSPVIQRYQPFLLSIQEKNDGKDTVYLNGAPATPNTGTPAATTTQTGIQALGCARATGGAPWDGLIAEILVFDRPSNLTATQFQEVNAYFLYKYGFYGTGPSIRQQPTNSTSPH